MNWNNSIRQLHRWLSVVFTLAVVITFIGVMQGSPPDWLNYLPLLPLFLLWLTGLYLFVLPYRAKWRSGRHTD